MRQQARQNLETAQGIVGLYEEMNLRFTDILASKYSTFALDYVFEHPVFRNSDFTSKANIPPATASRFSRALVQAGLLEEVRPASGRQSAIYQDRKSTRLNSSHVAISYAVFCLKKKKHQYQQKSSKKKKIKKISRERNT